MLFMQKGAGKENAVPLVYFVCGKFLIPSPNMLSLHQCKMFPVSYKIGIKEAPYVDAKR